MMMFKKPRLLLGLILLSTVPAAFAVERSDLRGDSRLLTQLQKNAASSGTSPDLHAAFGLAQGERLQLLRTNIDADGSTHTRYRQTLRGVPIWGEQIVVSRDRGGLVRSFHGALIKGLSAELNQMQPALDAAEALAAMKSSVANHLSKVAQFSNESVELVVYLHSDKPVLSYAVSFFADVDGGGEPTRPTFLVDATTGDVLFEYEGLTHSAEGTGPGGNEKVGEYRYGTDFGFLDVGVAGGTYTMNNAFAAFEENIKGSLTPGKLADVTVLSKDILTIPEDEIPSTQVVYTIVGGKVMYQRGEDE